MAVMVLPTVTGGDREPLGAASLQKEQHWWHQVQLVGTSLPDLRASEGDGV